MSEVWTEYFQKYLELMTNTFLLFNLFTKRPLFLCLSRHEIWFMGCIHPVYTLLGCTHSNPKRIEILGV